MEAALRAIAEPRRRQILSLIRASELSAGDIAGHFEVTWPAISQHLTVLRRSKLVTYEEFGTRNVYRLDTTGLEVLRDWTDSFWQTVLDSYADRVRADSAPVAPEPRHVTALPQDMQEPPHQQK